MTVREATDRNHTKPFTVLSGQSVLLLFGVHNEPLGLEAAVHEEPNHENALVVFGFGDEFALAPAA